MNYMKRFITLGVLLVLILMGSCSYSSENIQSESSHFLPSINSLENTPTHSEVSASQSFVDFTPYELYDYSPENWVNKIYPRPKTIEDIFIFEYPPRREVDVAEVDIIHVDGINADILPVITNTRPLEELMSPIYPGAVHELFENGDSQGGVYYDISKYKDIFPISFLRKTGIGQYYTVNKVYDGGYAYIFFERPRDYAAEDKGYITEDETEIVMTGCIYSEKLLKKSDFDNLQVGDTMTDVLAIDHATILPMQFCEWTEDIYGIKREKYLTKHLLKDGVIVITYSGDVQDSDYIVTNIQYFPDFIFLANDYFDPIYQGYPKNYTILPQDYPPET